MARKDLFIKRVYEIVQELKIPLLDERVHSKLVVNETRFGIITTFYFEEDESVIRGFLTLAEYFHSVVHKKGEAFYIAGGPDLYILEAK